MTTYRCLHITDKANYDKKNIECKINNIAANDLARVIIFAKDKDGNELLFIKDFFSRTKSRKMINRNIKKYINEIKIYKTKVVRINYHENDMGDLIILGISRI